MQSRGGLSEPLRDAVAKILGEGSGLCQADLAVALLRVGTPEALDHVQDVLGLRITRCPTAVPPRVPKPVRREATGPTLSLVTDNPCSPRTDAHRRYALVRVGMTREKLLARGVTVRDLKVWANRGWIAWQSP